MPHVYVGISFFSFIYLHCRKIHNLFVRALETGRKVHERKLSNLMKKMKESCKLDINQSVPENILWFAIVTDQDLSGASLFSLMFLF
jgi:hypothetical protein